MGDFVTDNKVLPTNKVDTGPAVGPATQRVIASEWNTVNQAAMDLRTHVKTIESSVQTLQDRVPSGVNTGDITVTNVGSSPNTQGISLSGQTLTLQPADTSRPGILTAGIQTIGGAKTFASPITAPNISGTNTGDLILNAVGSSPTANGASLSSQTLTLQPADATHPGTITAVAQTFGGIKKQIDTTLGNNPARRLLHPSVNVLDFGADPTGTVDSSDAFTNAMNSFAFTENIGRTLEHGFAGVVVIPYGSYRISKPIIVNHSVTFEGVSDAGASNIIGDPGITPFIITSLGIPWGTTFLGTGGGASIRNLIIQQSGKVANWVSNTHYNVGDKVRTGTGRGEDWRRHFICTQAGTSASSGNGPRSLGYDQELTVSGISGTFVKGERINGTSYLYDGFHTKPVGGEITAISGSVFRLTAVNTVFTVGDTVTGATSGATATVVSSKYPFAILKYKNLTSGFQAYNGKVITGATSGATANIQFDRNGLTVGGGNGEEARGFLMINNIQGTFVDNEVITDRYTGHAQCDGTVITDIPLDELDGTVRWKYLGNGSLVQMYVRATLDRVSIFSASGNGLHIEAQSSEQPNQFANANGWRCTNLAVYGNDGHGVFCNGSDANAGYLFGADFGGNGSPVSDHSFTGTGYNIYDSSFLGNTWVQCQMASGGIGSVFNDSIGGGATFLGCYVEGSGGGESILLNGCTVVGGGLSVPNWSISSSAAGVGPGGSRGGASTAIVAGLSALSYDFSPGYHIPYTGIRIENTFGDVYTATQAGIPAGVMPTGTGNGQVDGTVLWDYVGPSTNFGFAKLGMESFAGGNNGYDFLSFQAPPDIGVSLGITLRDRHAVYGGIQDFACWEFGNTSHVTYGFAHNRTLITEWPFAPRAATALLPEVYITGIRLTAGTGTPVQGIPTYLADTWNAGDIMWYKASAISSGGPLGQRCITSGTITPPNAIARNYTSTGTDTISITGGAISSLRLNADIHIGDMLNLNGTIARVIAIPTQTSLQMSATIPSGTHAIAYSPPTFEEIGGPVSLTAAGSSPNTNGATLSGQALTLQPANGTNPGLITAGTQTIGGLKTFSSTISSSVATGNKILQADSGNWGLKFVTDHMQFFVDGINLLDIDASVGILRSVYGIIPTTDGSKTLGISGNSWLAVTTLNIQDPIANNRLITPANDLSTYISWVVNGGTAIAHKFLSHNTLSTAGAKVAGFYSDFGTTQVASIDKDGRYAGLSLGVGVSNSNVVSTALAYQTGISFSNDAAGTALASVAGWSLAHVGSLLTFAFGGTAMVTLDALGTVNTKGITANKASSQVALSLTGTQGISLSGDAIGTGVTSGGWVLEADGAFLNFHYGNQLRLKFSQSSGMATFGFGVTAASYIASDASANALITGNGGHYVWDNQQNSVHTGIWVKDTNNTQMNFDVGGDGSGSGAGGTVLKLLQNGDLHAKKTVYSAAADGDYIFKGEGSTTFGLWMNSGVANFEVAGSVVGIFSLSAVDFGNAAYTRVNKLLIKEYTDGSGTSGNQTINKAHGKCKIAAGNSTITITNDHVDTAAYVDAVVETNDTTAQIKNIVKASGSFTINMVSAVTADTILSFLVIN